MKDKIRVTKTNLPGLKGQWIIASNPIMIYEGCAKEGQIPWIYQFAGFIKRLLK